MADPIVFTPPVNPSFPLEEAHTPRVKSLQFGDGYFQDIQDGINSDLRTMQLVWENVTEAESEAIMAVFKQAKGTTRLLYTMPMSSSEIQSKWKVPSFNRAKTTGNAYTVTATFQEVAEA